MSEVENVAAAELRQFIERIERLEAEKQTIAEDIKDVKSEAKGRGYDVAAINAIIKLRKKDANERAEEESILAAYMVALGMAPAFEPAPTSREDRAKRRTSEAMADHKTIIDEMADAGLISEEARHENKALADAVAAKFGNGPANPLQMRSETISETPKQVYGDSVAAATALPSQSVNIPAGGDQGHEIDGSDDRCPAELHSPKTANETVGGFPVAAAPTNAEETGVKGRDEEDAHENVVVKSVTVGGDESGTTVSIPLTNGKFAVVDADDAQVLMAYNWQAIKHGNVWYAKRRLENSDGKSVYMHRSIAVPKDGELVDHEDGDGLNNRKVNLRIAVQAQNRANAGPSKNNKIGVKGVYHDAERGKWIAKVCFDYGQEVIGRFDSIPEAAAAYDERAEMLWGEFAYLNRDHVDFNVVGTESGTVASPKVLDGRSPVAGESRHHCDVSEDEAGQTLAGNPIPEIAPASQGEAEAPSAERVNPEGGSAAASTGGDHVDAQPPHLEQAETAVSAVSATTGTKYLLRPHCRQRDMCRSGTTDHCHTCKRAMAEGVSS